MLIDYPFTEEQMAAAADQWGANCGPAALAFALNLHIDQVRGKIPNFEVRHYTSPTMMKAALAALGKTFTQPVTTGDDAMFSPDTASLVRVQWTGPWTKPGSNPKWAYRQTHWIATFTVDLARLVFDCNGGITGFNRWKTGIVPILTAATPRADGGWFPTNIWRITDAYTCTAAAARVT